MSSSTTKEIKKEMYKIMLYDSFDRWTALIWKTTSLEKAKTIADEKWGSMQIVYVHNSEWKIVYESGTY